MNQTEQESAVSGEREIGMGEMVAFLCGEASLDGHWFGDPPPYGVGAFWWRRPLRDAFAALAQPDARGEHRAHRVDSLLRGMLADDPEDMIADGVTVLMGWRKEAADLLALNPETRP